jgi:hypothetical protein
MLEDGWEKDQKEVHKWTKVQAEILNILLHNFRDHDKVILDAHAQATMQKEYADKYQQLPDYSATKRPISGKSAGCLTVPCALMLFDLAMQMANSSSFSAKQKPQLNRTHN